MKKRDRRWWNSLDYKSSIDYMLAIELEDYGFDPLEVVVWYYNKKQNIIIFQSHFKYYKIENKRIKEISEEEVWIKK